ncbi:hypothetical protein [Tatumella saanichensis]|uniref:hypothetical protein n=1 Tax=Tatumella saanichensis TaxID=480813 RepID=UPI0004A2276C|nr:hypothetical protein [Tatumella saanichensis]
MNETRTAREIIDQEYSEFPETILHAELCRATARADGRSIPKSMRAYARNRMNKVKSIPLQKCLRNMASSPFPETELRRIKACVGKMESALHQTFGISR